MISSSVKQRRSRPNESERQTAGGSQHHKMKQAAEWGEDDGVKESGWSSWFSFSWVRWVTILLNIGWLVLYIIAIFTAPHFKECLVDDDCLGEAYTCLANGRCSCTFADFTPDTYTGYRPYRCDPAGLAFHVDPVMLACRIVFFLAVIWVLFIDMDLTHYLAHSETIHELNKRLYRIERYLQKEGPGFLED